MRKQEIDYILTRMLDSHANVSDLNFTVGKPLQVETNGELVPVLIKPEIRSLTPFQTETVALYLLNQDRRLTEMLINTGSCDLSYTLPGKARFRINIFSQSGHHSIVLRKLEARVPTIRELNLPETFYTISREVNGIVFFTGATGSGKSTSLAAILEEINEKRSVHVVTLEDPIEFQHVHKKATFNQRELGTDFDSFPNGLRAALRQAPKVILVGEMRDRETVEIGLNAAETGHLVLATLHTVDAGQTVNRILGMFPREDERQVRIRLADTLRWAVGQRLLPKVGGGRVAAFDILGTNIRTRDVILNGESEGKTFLDIMRASRPFGMIPFDDHIISLYEKGEVTQETAITYASHRDAISRGIDRIKSARGESTSDIERLEIDLSYDTD
ncbi:PilT/PilU family type 4a pilus ATPase [Desulfosarcina sp. OttesenSCG-928-G10]|nr:PilT/PilU family type 4a pilus ATPase [Desulfosarcina sp. OttesenSCG-928-G10]MDL2321162.1 PilT/PilU family type 4a pilus ATPase [Desulfosarcina sp. OttesenSCG-928-B08]